MYDMLSDAELTVLKSIFFDGAEQVYDVAGPGQSGRLNLDLFSPVHAELADLFIEAACELRDRLCLARHEQAA